MKAFEEWRKLPPGDRADVRGRRHVDLGSSDKEIFAALETGDLWLDARVHETFLYLYGSKNCQLLVCIDLHDAREPLPVACLSLAALSVCSQDTRQLVWCHGELQG